MLPHLPLCREVVVQIKTQSTPSIPCMRVWEFHSLKGVKQSKGQEESQEEKKLEARKGESNTSVGYSKVLEDP